LVVSGPAATGAGDTGHNTVSLALAERYGFRHVGEQWDDEDGLEAVLEVEAVPSTTA